MRIGRIKGCELRIHPLLFLLFAAAIFVDGFVLLLISFAAVLYHEICHVLVAVMCGFSIKRIEVLPFGSVAQIQGLFEEHPHAEMLIALAGPAANVLLVMVLVTINHYTGHTFPYREEFIQANFQLAIFNLLPFLPMDGGRVLRSIMAHYISLGKATRIAADMGILGGTIMTVVGAMGYLGNPGLMVFLGITVVFTAIQERKNASWLWLREVTGKKEKLLSEETMAVRQIVARQDMLLGQLVLRFIPHRYHMVTVVDDSFRSIATLGENEVVDGLMKQGSAATIAAIIPGRG